MATKDVLETLCGQYQTANGTPVQVTSIGGVDAAKRVRAGEITDVVVLASNTIEQLIAEGHLLAASRKDLVKSGIAVAVKEGAAKPDLRNAMEVRDAVLAAKTISYSTGPSGVYLEKLFSQWGIFETIASRIIQAPPGVPVGQLVATGKAELGFQQLAELMHVRGITLLGPLPSDIQLITTFSAGIATTCVLPVAAKALIDFLSSEQSADAKRQAGMQAA